MTAYMDYTSPDVQFTYDLNNNTLFRKDACNYINLLSVKQLNTLKGTSLLDIFLNKSNVVEPHYHQNAAELVYCICGEAVVSLINPFTNELLHFPICPGQVANVPQGWWHYETATVDNTHLLAIFDAPVPEVILGSDLLALTPSNVLAHTYCLNEAKLKEALAPIQPGTFIGPPADCCPPGLVQAAATPNMKENSHHMMPMSGNMPLNNMMPMSGNMPPNNMMPMSGNMPPNNMMPMPYGYQQYPMPVYPMGMGYPRGFQPQPYVQPQFVDVSATAGKE